MQRDFIELVENTKIEGHYLPHHPVSKESETTPLRIVFNVSCKPTGGKSPNDCLYTRPSLTAKLHDISVQFREGKFAIVADISKAFQRVHVTPKDRKYFRFLCTDGKCVEQFTNGFKVVLFGVMRNS